MATALAPFWTATGRLGEASAWFGRVLELPAGVDVDSAKVRIEAAFVAFWEGDDGRATTLFDQALEIGRAIGDPTVTAVALTGLARVMLRSGDIAEARRLCREALAAREGSNDTRGRFSATHVLSVAAQMAGDLAEARELMTEQIALATELGSYLNVAAESCNLSFVERQLGNVDRAEQLAREALALARRREDEWLFPYALSSLAGVALERGGLGRAATLIGAAEAMMDEQGAAWPPDERQHYERAVSRLDKEMGSAEFERARAVGRSMSTQDGVAYALTADPEG